LDFPGEIVYYGKNFDEEIEMDVTKFVEEKTEEIKSTVGSEKAISALSGGVDSSACTVLAHRAIGDKLKVIFIDDGLMRENELRRSQKSLLISELKSISSMPRMNFSARSKDCPTLRMSAKHSGTHFIRFSEERSGTAVPDI
jgi:GMP synthase PP-ATPase subunit